MYTDIQGLSDSEVADLLSKIGYNTLPQTKRFTHVDHIIHQLSSPLIIILIAAGLVTGYLHDISDAVVIFMAVLINVILGYYQEQKAENALQALKNIITPKSKVIRNGKMMIVDTSHIVPGDILILTQGDKIAADAVVIDSVNLLVNEAMLTGESAAVLKKNDTEIYMGTVVAAGRGAARVIDTGSSTRMGKIAHELTGIDEGDTPLQQKLNVLSKQLAILIGVICSFILIAGISVGRSFTEMFATSVAVAVSAIPEGMLISLTVILAIGMQRILKQKALTRRLIAAETLGSVTVIATDKTGTLTEGNMRVKKFDLVDMNEAYQAAIITNNLEDSHESALWEWVESKGIEPELIVNRNKRLKEIPFDSSRKYVMVETAKAQYYKGAPDVLLDLCSLTESAKVPITETIQKWTSLGLRVYAFAKKSTRSERAKMEWVGLVGFEDPLRNDLSKVFHTAYQAGIRVIMLTGDHPGTAQHIWKRIHSGESAIEVNTGIIDGIELGKLSDEELAIKIKEVSIFARITPDQKLRIVKMLRSQGEVVALIGDGVNDAPAIKEADIGIVVGEASDVAKETADMILLDSNFKTIIKAIEEGRSMFDNIRKVVFYLLSDSFTEIIMVILSIVMGLPLPLVAAQILWINTITDSFPALSLTMEKKREDILTRKPTPKSAEIIDFSMKLLTGTISSTRALMSLAVFAFLVLHENVIVAQAVTFTTISMTSLINIFSTRFLDRPIWKQNIFSNPFLILSVFVGIIMQIASIYVPVLNIMLKTVPLQLHHWGIVMVYVILSITVMEMMKFVFVSRGFIKTEQG